MGKPTLSHADAILEGLKDEVEGTDTVTAHVKRQIDDLIANANKFDGRDADGYNYLVTSENGTRCVRLTKDSTDFNREEDDPSCAASLVVPGAFVEKVLQIKGDSFTSNGLMEAANLWIERVYNVKRAGQGAASRVACALEEPEATE